MNMVLRARFVRGLLASVFASTVLAACGPASSPPPSPQTPSPTTGADAAAGIELVEVPETANYREALAKDLGDISWAAITQTTGISQEAEAKAAAIQAIKDRATKLAAVDYASLSLDAFKDVTRQLHLTGDSFTRGDARLEYVGEQNGNPTWLLCDYKGEMIPQLPDRLLVFRWVQIYALYNIPNHVIIRLAATVRGEAHE